MCTVSGTVHEVHQLTESLSKHRVTDPNSSPPGSRMGLHDAVTSGDIAGDQDVLLRSIERKKSLGNKAPSSINMDPGPSTGEYPPRPPSGVDEGPVTHSFIFFSKVAGHRQTCTSLQDLNRNIKRFREIRR